MPHKRHTKSDSLKYITERRNAAAALSTYVDDLRQKNVEQLKKQVEEYKEQDIRGLVKVSCNGIAKTYADLEDIDVYDFV